MTDTNNNDDFQVRNENGTFEVRNDTDGYTPFSIASNNTVTVYNDLDINGDLDVDGHTNLDNVSIAGVTTFAGNIGGTATFNNIDVDGHTELDNVNIAGVATATDFDATSDIRLKTNVQPIEDPIAKVIQIEGVSFNWKKDDRPALGVIADQVEKILPQLVHGDDPKTVNYNGLVGLLIEVVKDQQKQIDTLSERISKLE